MNEQKKLVPKLRFPEFRGAKEWASAQMGSVYSFKGNNSLSRDKLNYVAGSIKNIHYGDIHTKFATHFDITKELVPFINKSEEGFTREENLCVEGDMVFADASEDLADIGKSIELMRLNGERVVSGLHTIVARRLDERIALGFGGHLFKSGWVRTQIQKEAQGAKVLGISPTRLRNLLLPLPHATAEQQKIANCLSSLDELIAAQGRKVEALKTHKKGLMQQLFPREGETQPRLRFPEFRGAALQSVLLGDVTEEGRSRNGKKHSVASVMGVNKSDGIVPMEARLIAADIARYKLVESDWFAYNPMRLNIGSIARWTGEREILVSPDYVVFKCITNGESSIVPDYLDHFRHTETWYSFVSEGGDGSVRVRIYYKDIAHIGLALPSPSEQQKIADCLTSLHTLVTAASQELETLKIHKKGLMQQLFPQTSNEATA